MWSWGKCITEELESGSYPGAQALERRLHLVSGWMDHAESLVWFFVACKGGNGPAGT